MNKIDLTICLRVYPWIADKQKVFCDDKFTIYQKSLTSLILSCWTLNVKYIIMLDACPEEYQIFTESILRDHNHEIISYKNKQWNAKTFRKQVEILTDTDCDIIYFAEDDYLYLENSIKRFIQDFRQDSAEFGTLYCSPDYKKFLIHDYKPIEKMYKTIRYWYFASTTMTFFAKRKALIKYQSWLLTYSQWNHDFSMRFTITKYNIFTIIKPFLYLFKDFWSFKLWWYIWYKCNIKNFIVPKWKLMIPLKSWATHIDKEWIDWSIDWKEVRKSISI